MAELIDDYLRHLQRTRRSTNTIDLRRSVLTRVARELALGLDYADDGLDHASPDELGDWLDNPRWTLKTRAAYHDALTGYYRWAVRAGHIDWSPMDEVDKVDVPRRLPRPVPRDQLEKIMVNAPAPYLVWFALGTYGGLRCCEIARLDREHITEEEMRLLGKGNKERVVPTHPAVWDLVRDLPPGPVAARAGVRLTPRLVSRLAREHLDRAGYPDVTMHRLRHSFATMTLEGNGGDLRTVQELLGHASPATTAVYTLVTSDRRRAAVHALPRLGLPLLRVQQDTKI